MIRGDLSKPRSFSDNVQFCIGSAVNIYSTKKQREKKWKYLKKFFFSSGYSLLYMENVISEARDPTIVPIPAAFTPYSSAV